MSGTGFGRMTGSDFNFTALLFDLRKYFSINSDQVIALQLYGNFLMNNPPFYQLAQLGGELLLRGYYKGRFRDKFYLASQIVYRIPVWWKFGIVTFVGIGDVTNSFSNFALNRLKYSYGAGLRFQIDEKEKLNLRMDFGIGKNSTGFYIGIGEAF